MGPGTGLGAAQLMWDEIQGDYRVWPGEGSHATFAPRGWKQQALAAYVTEKHNHCEIEQVSATTFSVPKCFVLLSLLPLGHYFSILLQVACGSGLELIYEFLLTDEVANRPDLLQKAKPKVRKSLVCSVSLRSLTVMRRILPWLHLIESLRYHFLGLGQERPPRHRGGRHFPSNHWC